MSDIVFGALTIGALSAVIFSVGAATARRRGASAAAAAAALFTVGFAFGFQGRPLLAGLLPSSNVVVLGNWIPLGAAMLSGIVWGQKTSPIWPRTVMAAGLFAAAWGTVVASLPETRVAAQDQWSRNRVCLQSLPASCSDCCAVTLLRDYGIRSSEQEMIELCLTGPRGTSPLGLYRGLKLKTKDTPWDVQFVRWRVEELGKAGGRPMILLVRSEDNPARLPLTPTAWAGRAEAEHAVVFYRLTGDGKAIIGDPAVGRCAWTLDNLRDRWGGEGLRLVPRKKGSGLFSTGFLRNSF